MNDTSRGPGWDIVESLVLVRQHGYPGFQQFEARAIGTNKPKKGDYLLHRVPESRLTKSRTH
jgi:hypothetical protein